MKVRTNKHWRLIGQKNEVPTDVLADQFDHLDPDEIDGFFRYRGSWYHLSEFMRFGYPGRTEIDGWQACLARSWSCGVVIRISNDGGRYQVGGWFA